jgi:hypothetical protein
LAESVEGASANGFSLGAVVVGAKKSSIAFRQ